MRKRLLVCVMLVCLTACTICGCGSASVHFPDVKGLFGQVVGNAHPEDSSFNAERELKNLEESINELDMEYLKEHIYMNSIDTDKEAMVAAAFLGDVLFNSAGKAVQAVSGILIHALENYDLASPKELESLREEWKDGLLKDLNYEITEYEVLTNEDSNSSDKALVRVHHNIQVGVISYSGEVYIEFVKDKDVWKLHVVPGECTE